ncbi:hypothetical protein Bca52824_045928 [Brassica carinata]|uniref:Uncharacterized protein n=1 Tax=Brassica carinata TaxID=52824 RepID=A0A8X7RBY8_BRACI|nr:hypothetical protein Bca52824_045928 [Brassica carinata]
MAAAAKKLVAWFLLLAFVFTTGVFSDAGQEPTSAESVSGSEIQLDQLNAKIRSLVILLLSWVKNLKLMRKLEKLKGELVQQKDELLHERQDKLSSLETQLSSLREKGSSDSVQLLEKAKARATELEKQVEVLRNFLEQKNKEKESVEARTTNINKKVLQLHKTKEEQKSKIRNLRRALRISEEEMLRMRHEAATKARELQEVHGSWLPHWLAVHWIHFQTVAGTHWDAHGKPVMEKVTQKEAKKFSKPYVDQVSTATKPHVDKVRATMKPYTKKAVHYYKEFLKTATTYHHQVQANVERKLKSHELAAPLSH